MKTIKFNKEFSKQEIFLKTLIEKELTKNKLPDSLFFIIEVAKFTLKILKRHPKYEIEKAVKESTILVKKIFKAQIKQYKCTL